jgi:betaine-aldehyde dehydrogenase
VKEIRLFIGNEWRDPESRQTFATSCPDRDETLARLAAATSCDVDAAVGAAGREFPGRWNTAAHERADLMNAALAMIECRHPKLAEWDGRDVANPIYGALNVDLPCPFRAMEYFSNLSRQIRGDVIPLPQNDALCYETWEPYGVVGSIVAWNSPIHIAMRAICSALSAGNARRARDRRRRGGRGRR